MNRLFSRTRRSNWQEILVALAAVTAILTTRQDLAAQSPVAAPARPTIKVLGIGNSFTGNAFSLLHPIARRCDKVELVLGQANIGGCSMEKHMRLAKIHESDPEHQDGRPYRLSKTNDQGKQLRVQVGLREMLTSNDWDIVTIQQLSRESPNVASYRPYARELYDYIKKYAPQAEVVLHQTWAYRVDGDFEKVFRDRPGYGQQDMHRELTKAYHTIADELGVRIIPVGAAFQLARQRRPFVPDASVDISTLAPPQLPPQAESLCAGWRWDRSVKPPQLRCDSHHAGVRGCFLAAAVWFEFLTGLNVNAENLKAGDIPDSDARFLGQVAHEAIRQQAKVPGGVTQ